MKTIILNFAFVLFVLDCSNCLAQNDSVAIDNYRTGMNLLFDGLDTNQITTGILINRSPADSTFYYFDGKKDSILDYASFLFNYNNIQMSKRNYSSGNPFLLIDSAVSTKNFTPLGICYYDYERLSDSAFNETNISFINGSLVKTNPSLNVYRKATYFASAPMNFMIVGTANFMLDSEFIYTNKNLSDVLFLADFGDNTGIHQLSFNQQYNINYPNGIAIVTVYLVVEGDTIKSASKIYVKNSDETERTAGFCDYLEPDIPVTNLSADISCGLIESGMPTGQYAVWLGCGNDNNGTDPNTLADIKKPFLISAGFNPLSGKRLNKCDLSIIESSDILSTIASFTSIIAITGGVAPNLTAVLDFIITTDIYGGWRGTYYETYNGTYNKFFSTNPGETKNKDNGSKYLDKLREEGYDIVIVLYDNGTDYLQNNAAVMVSLIKIMNNQLRLNGSKEELVVGGYSAGAVTSRLALSKMEENFNTSPSTIFPHPHAKLWVSIEGEFQGANTPLGFQHFIDYLCRFGAFSPFEVLSIALAKSTRKQFDTETSKQLSSTHYSWTDNGNNARRHSDRTSLVNLQNQLGYPETCRNVGVSMGNGFGISYPIDHNQYMFHLNVRHTINLFYKVSMDIHKEVNAFFTPVSPGQAELANRDIGIKFKFFGHSYNINMLQQYNERHITVNNCEPWDNCPGSLFAANRTFNGSGGELIYSYLLNTSPWMMQSSYSHSPSNHSFAATASCLDLHNNWAPYSIAPITASPFNMGLMKSYRLNGNLINSPNWDYGYPHISYPSNHYSITPFDAIWAVGLNSKTEPDPTDNHFHVEDPQPLMTDFIVGEIAPEHLYLSNRIINQPLPSYSYYDISTGVTTTTTQYQAAFDTRRKIFCGNDVYYIQSFGTNGALLPTKELTAKGDFIVGRNGDVVFTAGEEINILPGFEAQFGSKYLAEITTHTCTNNYEINRLTQVGDINLTATNDILEKSIIPLEKNKLNEKQKYTVFPIPTNDAINIGGIEEAKQIQVNISDIYGKKIKAFYVSSKDNKIYLSNFSSGMYLLDIHENGIFIQSQKIIVQSQ